MHQRTEQMPYGKRRLLEMAIALACEPQACCCWTSQSPVCQRASEKSLLHTVSAKLPADVSVVLIEHDMDLVFELCQSHHGVS